MAIKVSQAFERTSANPIDASLALTKTQMVAVNDNLQPSKYFTVCQDDGYIYLYDKTNTADPTTGKFRKFEGGGGGGASSMSDLTDVLLTSLANGQTLAWDSSASKWKNVDFPSVPSIANCYETTDPADTVFEDEDKIPYYNVSIPAKKHSTWANLKASLKTYFDTIYSTITAIGSLTDVNISSVTNGQVLKYDSSSSKWVNANESGGGGASALEDLSDVDVSSPVSGQVLQYDGTNWINGSAGGGSSASRKNATLTAGSTTVTFTNMPTSGDYYVRFTNALAINYTAINTSIAGQITLTYPVQQSDLEIYCIYEMMGGGNIPDGSRVTPTDDVQTWLHCANIWDKNYTTLSQVLLDTLTLITLIASNNAVNYMVRSTTFAPTICGDSSAMTQMKISTYCSDAILANSTWRAAVCDSEYFDIILDYTVPVMTSNTTSSSTVIGECIGNSKYSASYDYYKAFDGNDGTWWTTSDYFDGGYVGIKYNSPVKIYKAVLKTMRNLNPSSISICVETSADGTTWNKRSADVALSNKAETLSFNLNAIDNVEYYRIYSSGRWAQGGTGTYGIYTLQFYGIAPTT